METSTYTATVHVLVGKETTISEILEVIIVTKIGIGIDKATSTILLDMSCGWIIAVPPRPLPPRGAYPPRVGARFGNVLVGGKLADVPDVDGGD